MVSKEDKMMYKLMFDSADTNNDGFLSSKELFNIMNTFGAKLPRKQCDLIVRMVDRDNNGKLDFNEFMEILSDNIGDFETEDEIRRLFRVFDRKNTGYITRKDLKEVMEVMDEKLTEAELDEAMKEADTNKDGKINVDEFITLMKSSNKK